MGAQTEKYNSGLSATLSIVLLAACLENVYSMRYYNEYEYYDDDDYPGKNLLKCDLDIC